MLSLNAAGPLLLLLLGAVLGTAGDDPEVVLLESDSGVWLAQAQSSSESLCVYTHMCVWGGASVLIVALSGGAAAQCHSSKCLLSS